MDTILKMDQWRKVSGNKNKNNNNNKNNNTN